MKKTFSTSWKSSKQPRKQRKYIAKAPLHLKRKLLSVNLSKELRKKHNKRNISVRKGDVVKIMRGKFKNKQGKITEVKIKTSRVYIEGIQVKKQDGSKANIPFRASNLQIIEMNLEDKKRLKTRKETKKSEKPEKGKKTESSSKTRARKAEKNLIRKQRNRKKPEKSKIKAKEEKKK